MAEKALIVYFSGTGGTALAAQTLLKSLSGRDVETRVSELFRESSPKVEPDEVLILMYPVYAFDAPSPVYGWIDSLKKTQDDGKATVISVSGGGSMSPNTACRAKVIKRLERKGYKVTNEYMLCMPTNFIMPTPEDIAGKLIRVLPEKCALIADEIAMGTINRKNPLFIDRLLVALFSVEKVGARFFGESLKANDECNGCSLCALKCPLGNIIIEGGRPKFGWKCVICMRCIYSCPKNAIHASLPVLKRIVIKDGFDLKQIRESAEKFGAESILASDVGFLWKAVARYIADKTI